MSKVEVDEEERRVKHMREVIRVSEMYMTLWDMPRSVAEPYASALISGNLDLEILILKWHMENFSREIM